ncbi:MAG: LacI family DNA-binding transcriptional regulator [Phycisphaerae bacterium]
MAKVTIEDISRQTGLSRGTVSRALNDRPDISSQTKQRVLDACRKLNYIPSHAARTLATGRNFACVTLLDNLSTPLNLAFLHGVVHHAEATHQVVYPLELEADPGAAADRLNRFSADRIDTILVACPLALEVTAALRTAVGARPVVSCYPLEDLACDVIAPDYAESGRLVARRLLREGSRSILYVHRNRFLGASERRAGFEAIVHEHGVDVSRAVLAVDAHVSASALVEALRGRLEGLSGIGASDDALALSVMLACRQLGFAPGVDIAVMGQGNDALAAEVAPALTTVDYSGAEIGQRAIETATQRLTKARADAFQSVQVAPQLIERDSTRAVRT